MTASLAITGKLNTIEQVADVLAREEADEENARGS